MVKDNIYDVAIVGGGLAGLTLSCLLGQSGVKTLCLDAAPSKPIGQSDLRTTAISYGSQKILERAGIWENLDISPCPILDIQILDGTSPVLLNFLSEEVEDKAFGWIVENVILRAAQLKTLAGLENVTHLTGTQVRDFQIAEDHDTVSVFCDQGGKEAVFTARLVVGADGRGSFTREFMGVQTRGWSYEQRAVICTVEHEHPHHNVAVEHFWPQGPFAILPMSDSEEGRHRSSVVFTEHGPEKNSLIKMSEEAFMLALAARFPERYGDIRLIGARAAYPLGLIHAAAYIAPRMALVADAAHGIHPIAGQGLNLGFRDIDALADLVCAAHQRGEDPGNEGLLEAYERARRADNTSMVAVTDGLNRLFSNNIMPVRVLRKAGLKAVSKIPAAKRFFMRRAMGD